MSPRGCELTTIRPSTINSSWFLTPVCPGNLLWWSLFGHSNLLDVPCYKVDWSTSTCKLCTHRIRFEDLLAGHALKLLFEVVGMWYHHRSSLRTMLNLNNHGRRTKSSLSSCIISGRWWNLSNRSWHHLLFDVKFIVNVRSRVLLLGNFKRNHLGIIFSTLVGEIFLLWRSTFLGPRRIPLIDSVRSISSVSLVNIIVIKFHLSTLSRLVLTILLIYDILLIIWDHLSWSLSHLRFFDWINIQLFFWNLNIL